MSNSDKHIRINAAIEHVNCTRAQVINPVDGRQWRGFAKLADLLADYIIETAGDALLLQEDAQHAKALLAIVYK